MFGDPLSRPTAIVEAILLMALAAIVGWIIARLLLAARLKAAQADLANRQTELAECRKRKTVRPAAVVPPAPVVVPPPPVATPEPVSVTPTIEAAPETTPAIEWLTPAAAVGAVAATVSTGKSEADALARIAARAGEVNFDRIGVAAAHEADDLKEIVGVGPFLERKLHSLGIYTFRQVANFHKEDIDKVNDIIEFFPGRIERDNWVDQSKELHEKKYGTKA